MKDSAGIITPQNTYDFSSKLKKEIDVSLHFHAHCTGGMCMMAYLQACEAGVDNLDTVISPFACGTSQPPCESMVSALQGTKVTKLQGFVTRPEIACFSLK